MARIIFPAPDPLDVEGLTEELATAGFVVAVDHDRRDQAIRLVGAFTQRDLPALADVVAAHTGQPSTAEVRRAEALAELQELRNIPASFLLKARDVRAGTDTFTVAQLQRIAAETVIYLAREQEASS